MWDARADSGQGCSSIVVLYTTAVWEILERRIMHNLPNVPTDAYEMYHTVKLLNACINALLFAIVAIHQNSHLLYDSKYCQIFSNISCRTVNGKFTTDQPEFVNI